MKIRDFVLGRLNEGAAPMTILREAQDRFGHCGWLYVLKIKRQREDAIDTAIAERRIAELKP